MKKKELLFISEEILFSFFLSVRLYPEFIFSSCTKVDLDNINPTVSNKMQIFAKRVIFDTT